MNTHTDKTQENKSGLHAAALPRQQSNTQPSLRFTDNRPQAVAQRKLQQGIQDSPKLKQLKIYQRKANNTGLPDNLKSGIENLSGYSMNDVKVHYNSDKPAQLQAHAFAQGTTIHIAAGQEKHLAHEAWHVVQQKQGRVRPTLQLKGKVNINDDAGLEKEADRMGARALHYKTEDPVAGGSAVIQQYALVSSTPFSAMQLMAVKPPPAVLQLKCSACQKHEHGGDEESRRTAPQPVKLKAPCTTCGGKKTFQKKEIHNKPMPGSVLQLAKQEQVIQRVITVEDADENIAGAGRTAGAEVAVHLATLCPDAGVTVDDGSGVVALAGGFCEERLAAAAHPTSCNCVCDLVNSRNNWQIIVHPRAEPSTNARNQIRIPSTTSAKAYGSVDADGTMGHFTPDWLVLAHELCGHAWLMEQGRHHEDEARPRGEGGHQATVARENLVRGEHGIALRGTFMDPYCGESYSDNRVGNIESEWSPEVFTCRAWREARGFTIDQKITPALMRQVQRNMFMRSGLEFHAKAALWVDGIGESVSGKLMAAGFVYNGGIGVWLSGAGEPLTFAQVDAAVAL